MTNWRILRNRFRKILVATVILTAIGIPLRPAISGLDRSALRDAARQRFGLRSDGPVLMVTGGSQGARAINRRMRRSSFA